MFKPVGGISELYRMYREYKDNQTMYKLYPYNPNYLDRSVALSDLMDMKAYEIALSWSKYEPNVNTVTTHLRSLMKRLYDNKIYLQHATPTYTMHYYDDETGKWLYRDGSVKKPISLYHQNVEGPGFCLLSDIKASTVSDSWV